MNKQLKYAFLIHICKYLGIALVSGSIVQITPAVVGYAIIGAVILGFFAGLYPAWRASSMSPVEAINKGN